MQAQSGIRDSALFIVNRAADRVFGPRWKIFFHAPPQERVDQVKNLYTKTVRLTASYRETNDRSTENDKNKSKIVGPRPFPDGRDPVISTCFLPPSSALIRCGRCSTPCSGRFTLGKETRHPLGRTLGSAQCQYGRAWRRENPLPHRGSNFEPSSP